jgi:hypothetical protein
MFLSPSLIFKKIFLLSTLTYTCWSFTSQPAKRWHRPEVFSIFCDGMAKDSEQTIWNHLIQQFQGDFDNYAQVVEDRAQDKLPKEGGGHENFHCTLIPLSETSRLASFYFDGNPQRIFRFRYYELFPASDSDSIEMKLYTLHPELEGLLRSHSEEPLKWRSLYDSFDIKDEEKIKYLPNCEITWSLQMDPVEHSYAVSIDDNDGIHAVMVHGEAIVDSAIIPGMKIRILDQLSLYRDTFYINDRGLDPETGDFIYGNHRGVPYRLERVTCLANGDREVVNDDLKWTMGERWRSEEEYDLKMNAIGGPSAKMNAKPSQTDETR